jgi:tetratricopeptide (TPR) repeat protein
MRIALAVLVGTVGFVLSGAGAQAQESAAVLMQQKHWKRVRAIAQAKLRTSPDDPEANFLMSRVLLAWNDPGAALPFAEKAVKLAPQNAEYHWALAEAVGTEAERANLFRQIGLARRFRSEAETVLKLDPKHVEAHFGMMIYYLKAPGIVGGDKKKAYAEAEVIGKIDRAKGYFAQVRLAQEEQRRDKIDGLYKNAIEADPKFVDAYVGLIGITSNAGNVADTERYARQVLSIDPKRVTATARSRGASQSRSAGTIWIASSPTVKPPFRTTTCRTTSRRTRSSTRRRISREPSATCAST